MPRPLPEICPHGQIGDCQECSSMSTDAPLRKIRIYSIDEQIQAVRTELRMRDRVYPRLVTDGKMTHLEADERRGAMLAVLGTLEGLRAAQRPELF